MPIDSRDKGKRGELELAALLREYGFEDARRGQQHSGGSESPDVVGLPADIHPECKRVERGNLYDWLSQAERDAAPGQTPVVMHRRSRKPWVAILPLSDFLRIIRGRIDA